MWRQQHHQKDLHHLPIMIVAVVVVVTACFLRKVLLFIMFVRPSKSL
jgi:hypothetical protein